MLNAFYNGGRLINANTSRRNANASAGFIVRLNRGELPVEDLSDNEKLKSAMNLVNSERVFTGPREYKLDSSSLTQITSVVQLFILSEEDNPARSIKAELNEFNENASVVNPRYDDLAINFLKRTAVNEDIAEWAIGTYTNVKVDLGYLKKGFIVDVKDNESGSLIKAEDTFRQYKCIRYFHIIQCIFKNIQSYKGDSSKISEKEGIILRTIQWLLKFANMATDVINSDNNKADKTLGYAGASLSFKSLYTLLIITLGRDILYNDDSMYKYLKQAIDTFDKSRNDFSRAEMNEKPKDSIGKTVKTEKKGFLGKLNSLFNI